MPQRHFESLGGESGEEEKKQETYYSLFSICYYYYYYFIKLYTTHCTVTVYRTCDMIYHISYDMCSRVLVPLLFSCPYRII